MHDLTPRGRQALADRLRADSTQVLTDLEHHLAPGLVPPAVLAGHPVDGAALADLVFCLGLLVRSGVRDVAGIEPGGRARQVIADLDPATVEAFASYRVGETVLALGGLDQMEDPAHVLACVDTSSTAQAVRDDQLPPNYAVVVARCLAAQRALTGEEPEAWPEFLDRAGDLFDTATGWIDDGPGVLRHFDIYSPDMYLFAEPLAADLGGAWSDGLAALLEDLDDLVQPGGAVVWGRSIGALALAMTVELAALAVRPELDAPAARWLERADHARRTLARDWFSQGLVGAHQHRSTMFYRGPERRLQMTLDLVGKLLSAGLELAEHADPTDAAAHRSPPAPDGRTAFATVDRLVGCEPGGTGGVWSHRSPHLSLALPVMFGWSTDYLPTPRSPGTFEVPTSGPPCFVPVLHQGATALVPAGEAEAAEHSNAGLDLRHGGWAPVGQDHDGPGAVGGGRDAGYRIDGRTLVIDEVLRLDDPESIDVVAVAVPETGERPLVVHAEVETDGATVPVAVRTVETEGIAEWRSFWSSIERVHQFELEPASELNVRWSVTPQVRIADTIQGHPYSDELYRPLADRLVRRPAPAPDPGLTGRLLDTDVLHLAWPEWWTGTDPEWTAAVIDAVRRSGTKIVWTQHNLAPHADKGPEAVDCYRAWAASADAVIHHSEHGRKVALERYDYGEHTRHVVVGHGHWGRRHDVHGGWTRELAEGENGWPPCGLRLGVIGAPRVEKQLQAVLDGFAATDRDDLQLVIRVGEEEQIPEDPRIIAERLMIDEGLYVRRLAGFDALVLPFAPAGMLTTGTAFDAIGAGLAVLTSEWAFFDETFAGADIRYGTSADDFRRCLEGLSREALDRSAAAVAARREHYTWEGAAERTLALFEELTA